VALFRREGRRMMLTARGRDLVRDVEPLWAGLESALSKASDFAGTTGVVRIGTGEIAAASCLPGFIGAIERDLPGVTLEVELDLTARMLQQVLGGTSDLVLLAGPVASPGIRTAAIGSVGLVWAASPGTAAAEQMANGAPVWSIPSHSPLHGVMLETLALHGIHPRTIGTCNNVRTLIEIVLAGRGAALLPETMVRADLASGALVEVLPRPTRQIRFEAAIRSTEQDPLILELFRRAGALEIDP
jgi:DNA-binding transcriptional LysR family regulator